MANLKCPAFLLLLISVILFGLVDSRGGGGRGGRGRGRGHSGSRGGMRAKSSVIRTNVRGTSTFNGGVRTGTSGFKIGSTTGSTGNYGSGNFRNKMITGGYMHSSLHSTKLGNPLIIVAAMTPMFYDNRNYYWSYNAAMINRTVTKSNILCEYVFGNDDGELQNITFQNGTSARAIYFGCQGMVNCCGMYCCHDFHQVFELLFLVGFCLIFIRIAWYAKKREPARPKKSDSDIIPLKSGQNNKKSSTTTSKKQIHNQEERPLTFPQTRATAPPQSPLPPTSSSQPLPQAPPSYGFIQFSDY